MRLGDRIPLTSMDSAYWYDMDTLIMHLPHSREIIEENDILSYERGLFHEHFHWLQHHGTTIGSLLSLLGFRKNLLCLDGFHVYQKN